MATRPASAPLRLNLAARLPAFCFKLAAFTAVIGVSLGVYMGIGRDHSLAPVHVHLNLIGWVSLFLFGLYYRLHERALGTTAIVQVALTTAGYVAMMSGLAGYLLTGSASFMPLAVFGSLTLWAGFALFFVIVAKTAS